MRSALDMGGPIDVDKVVQNMRMARNFMVQTEIQYMFIFRAVLDASLELLSGESTKVRTAYGLFFVLFVLCPSLFS